MQLTLTAEEAAMLRDILESELGELRMEIGATESPDYRARLQRREVFIKRLIAHLSGAGSGPG
jgi:hypothetical protein